MLIAFALTAGTAAALSPNPQPSPEARAAWGFERSDLAPDPAIRFGMLGNLLRYAILRHRTPEGAVAVRMSIRAGAADRAPGEAHYLEHLAFQGVRARLEAEGLALGRDFSAHTAYFDTLYRIDLPASRTELMLALLREMAGAPGLAPEAVERARDEVRAEARERAQWSDLFERDEIGFFIPGTRVARQSLTGSEAEVDAVGAAGLSRFHAFHYLPHATTLIIVGDVDPAEAEAWIRAHFGGWHAGYPVPPPPSEPIDPARGTAFHLLVAPDAPTVVTVAAITARDSAGDQAARRDRDFLERLGADMLAARMAWSDRGDRPLVEAEAAVEDFHMTARMAAFRLTAFDDNVEATLRAAERELRRALVHGFSQAELDAELRREAGRLAALAGARTSAELADRIARMAGAGIVVTAPGSADGAAAYLARIRLDDVNAAFRAAWAAPGRMVHVTHDSPIEGGEARLARIWAASARRSVRPIAAPAAGSSAPDPRSPGRR